MVDLMNNIVLVQVFSESECERIIDSKGEFIESPQKMNDKKYNIIPDESNYTFGHTNFPYWHLEFSDENEWFFEKVRESIDMVNMKFFKFENLGLWNSGIKEYSNGYCEGVRDNNFYDWIVILPINISVATSGFYAGIETKTNSAVIRAYKVVLEQMLTETVTRLDALEPEND